MSISLKFLQQPIKTSRIINKQQTKGERLQEFISEFGKLIYSIHMSLTREIEIYNMAVTTHSYGKNLLFVEGLRNDDMDIMVIDSPNW